MSVFVKATSPHSAEEAPRFEEAEVAACLNGWDERHNPPKHLAIAIQDTTTREKKQNGRGWNDDGTSYTLDAAATQGVAIPLDLRNAGRDPEKHDEINRQGVGVGAHGEPSHTISTACVHGVAFGGNIARTLQARHDSSPCADRGMDVVAVDCYDQTTNETSQALSSSASDINHTGGVINPAQAMAVRRLTPRECERLQGFSDDHTLIPWRGKPADQCPDGPRYKALGNSMAVPCMAWIGKRIAAQEMFPLRYLSVCSGIEAASVAWEPLGWQPAAFSEVEKFPSAVLAHHWPDVPNLGDMTQYEQWKELGAIDLLVGGTPCQSFSVAGLRQGLRDPRGGLMLTYLEIARSFGPRWLVWENVPGVLSSHGGRDFGAFLGALGALGYGWAYRVLDAQWFGVAQRRRRVFVVANLGDGAAAAKVLFERESVCRNPAPSREAGERASGNAEDGAGIRCKSPTLTKRMQGSSGWAPYNEDAHLVPWPADVAATLRRENGTPGYADQDIFSQNGANLVPSVAQTLSSRDYKGPSCGRDGVVGNPIPVFRQ